MESDALFDPPPPAEPADSVSGWMTVTRQEVTHIVTDYFTAAPPVVRPGQRDFFPQKAVYRWTWKRGRGWDLDWYEVSGPNRKVDKTVGLMTVTHRVHGTHPESWASLPDWLYLAMVATRPDWEPPAAELQPAEGAVEALLAAHDQEDTADE